MTLVGGFGYILIGGNFMENNEYFRVRLNTKQTAKGEYYLDVTTDCQTNHAEMTPEQQAEIHMSYVEALGKSLIDSGRVLVEVKK